jgi:hypothetical protein
MPLATLGFASAITTERLHVFFEGTLQVGRHLSNCKFDSITGSSCKEVALIADELREVNVRELARVALATLRRCQWHQWHPV